MNSVLHLLKILSTKRPIKTKFTIESNHHKETQSNRLPQSLQTITNYKKSLLSVSAKSNKDKEKSIKFKQNRNHFVVRHVMQEKEIEESPLVEGRWRRAQNYRKEDWGKQRMRRRCIVGFLFLFDFFLTWAKELHIKDSFQGNMKCYPGK